MRIGLFATCLGDTLFPEAVKSTAVLLARLGHDVVFPPGQTCCGQMHVNTGYQREPVPLVRNFAEQFGDTSIDAVVMPSASCAGSVRHQHEIVAGRYGDAALRAVEEIDLVELPEADACCGFGGTFALKNSETSTAMLQDKMHHISGTKADVCTAGDSSCLMQIGGGLSRIRSGTRTLHLAQILGSTRTAPYALTEAAL